MATKDVDREVEIALIYSEDSYEYDDYRTIITSISEWTKVSKDDAVALQTHLYNIELFKGNYPKVLYKPSGDDTILAVQEAIEYAKELEAKKEEAAKKRKLAAAKRKKLKNVKDKATRKAMFDELSEEFASNPKV